MATTKQDMEAIKEYARSSMAWFRHMSNSGTNDKLRKLMIRCGVEGYGRWWLMCEYLATVTGHKVSLQTEEDMTLLVQSLQFQGGPFNDLVAREACRKFIDNLIDLNLVQVNEDGEIHCEHMDEEALYFGRQRYNASKGGSSRRKKKPAEVSDEAE